MDPYKIIKHPISTEKAVRLMETDNILTFIVDKNSKKIEIKKAIEELFKVKIVKTTTLITHRGKKKAYVKISADTPAIDIATQLGLM